VQSADEFLSHALSLDPVTVHQALAKQAAIKKNLPMTVADVLARLEWTAPNFVREARGAWGSQHRLGMKEASAHSGGQR
jgi:2-hydroxychromene-2-carboxylate isomerase